MKTTPKITLSMTRMATAFLVAGAGLALLPAVHAQTLAFTNTPASSAATAMDKRYGITIVFRGTVNTSQPVTFSIDNPDTPDGRLQAISSLAGAMGVDFQKVYVVSKADPGAAIPPVPVDSNGPVVFTSTHVPVRDAIQTVAAVDNAITQINSAITGEVTLPSTHLTAPEAAASIAKQTGTEWKTYYGFFRRGERPARFDGLVIGDTNGGQPITVQPLLTFRSAAPVAVPLHNGQDSVVSLPTPQSAAPDVFTFPDTNFAFAPDAGFGFGDPYGYTNPYGAYGYGDPYGGVPAPGAVLAPGTGAGGAIPAGGPSGTTLLPGVPSGGSVGGQANIGGY